MAFDFSQGELVPKSNNPATSNFDFQSGKSRGGFVFAPTSSPTIPVPGSGDPNKPIIDDQLGIGKFIKGTVDEGLHQLGNAGRALGDTMKPDFNSTDKLLSSGARIAGGVTGAVLSPLTTAFSMSQKGIGNQLPPNISKFIGHIIDPNDPKSIPAVLSNIPALQKFAQENPNAEEVIGAFMNILGAAGLPDAAAGAGDAASTLSEKVSSVLDATLEKGKGALETVKSKVLGSPEQKAADALKKSVQDTMPLQSKDVRIDELRNSYPGENKGGVVRKGKLGTSTAEPSTADIERGNVANEYIQGESDPLVRIQKVNEGIKTESTKTDAFLDKNSAPTNFADMRSYLESNNKPPLNIQKDTTAFESYSRSNENALNTLYQTMKERATETGNFGSTPPASAIREARIAIDQQITKELGEETFGTPQYKGIKAAEINVRNVVNRMSEDMLRYPGQLEQLNKYNEFIDSLQSRNPDVKIDPTYDAELKAKFGLKSTPESEAHAQSLADQHSRMSHLYDARDNMIDKYQSSVGKNRYQEFTKNNPGKTKILKYGVAAAAGAGGLPIIKKILP